jgi:DNA-binding Xre family transcriptional regulator
MTVKIKLKELREANGVTQRELAIFLNTTETNYRRIEKQTIESISYKTLDSLCKYFNCTPNDILEFTND